MTDQKKIDAVDQQAKAFMKQAMPYATKHEADKLNAIKLALTTLTDKQQTSVIDACFKFYGFQIIGTGGGCSAFETDYEVGDGQMVLMITDANCGTPETIGDDVLVGPHYPNDPDFGIHEGQAVELEGDYAYRQPDNWIDCLALIAQDWMILSVIEEQVIKVKAGEAIASLTTIGSIMKNFVDVFIPNMKPSSSRFAFKAAVKNGKLLLRLLGPCFDHEMLTLNAWTVEVDRQNLAFFNHCASGSRHLVQNFDLEEFVNEDSINAFEAIERELMEAAADAVISRSEYEAENGLTGQFQKKQEEMRLADDVSDEDFDNAVMDCFNRIVKGERSIHFNLPRKVDGMLEFSCKGLSVDHMKFQLVVDCNVDDETRFSGPVDGPDRWLLNAMTKDCASLEGSSFMLNDNDANEVQAFDLAEWIFETVNAWRIAKEMLATVFASLKAGSFDFLPDPRGRCWTTTRFGTTITANWIWSDDNFVHSLLLNGTLSGSKIKSDMTVRIREGIAVDIVQDVMEFCHHMTRTV
jgi:hypothetical protein